MVLCKVFHGVVGTVLQEPGVMKPTKEQGKTLQVTKEDGQRGRERIKVNNWWMCVCVHSCLASVIKHTASLPNK